MNHYLRIVFVCISILLSASFPLNAQLSAFQLGNFDIDQGNVVAVDKFGNQYLSLTFQHNVDASPGGSYDSLQLGGCPNNNNSTTVATGLIALDPQGNYKWKLQPSGVNCNAYDARIAAIAFDSSGYLWVAGGMDGDVDIDPGSGVTTSNYNQATFLWKIDTAGNVIRVLAFNTAAPVNVYGSTKLVVTPCNDVILSCLFSGTCDTDPGAGTSNVISNGTRDYCIVRLDSNGIFKHSMSFGSTNMEQICTILIDNDENLFLFGEYQTQIDIAPGPSVYTLIGPGSMNGQAAFILKVDSSFTFQWGGRIGNNGSGQVYPRMITFDAEGDLIVYGLYSGNVDFDISPNFQYHQAGGLTDIFRLELNPTNGAYKKWYTLYQTTWGDFPVFTPADNGEALIAGNTNINFTTDLNPGPGVYTPIPFGGYDMFVMRTDSMFNMKWVKRYPGNLNDCATMAVEAGNGNYLIGGWFKGTINIENVPMTAGGDEDAFFTSTFIPGNSIYGRIYIDWNGSMNYDAGDTAASVPLFNFENIVQTPNYNSIDGTYNLYTSTSGSAVLNYLNPPQYFTLNTAQYTFPFGNSVNQSSTQNDFILTPIPGITDFNVNIVGVNNRTLGQPSAYSISVTNQGTTTCGGVLTFFPDSSLTFLSSDIAPSIISSDSIVWNLPLMQPFDRFEPSVEFSMSGNFNFFGDTLPVQATVRPLFSDSVIIDNYDTILQIVNGAYDPNCKETRQWIKLDTSYHHASKSLEYTIHFQNTGTANTSYVIVRDTIDTTLLDLSTFQFIQSSHPCIYQINPGNEILFYFNPIALVPQSISDIDSRGHATFRINTNSSFGIGDSIHNRAYIFFDANPAIITDWHFNYIENSEDVSTADQPATENRFTLFPNPTVDYLRIEYQGDFAPTFITILDNTGRVVQYSNYTSLIDVSLLESGNYLIQIEFEDGSSSSQQFFICK